MEAINNYTVYIHISPSNKKYIGITKQKPEYRWKKGKGYKYNKHFYSAIQKYGWNNFQHIIIEEKLSKKEAIEKEIKLIEKYHSTNEIYGYNITKGGDGLNGVKASYESRLKMSKNHHHRDQFKSKNPVARQVVNLNDSTVFCTIREANKSINKKDTNSAISAVCTGRKKHAGIDKNGLKIKRQYLDDYLIKNNLSIDEAKKYLTFIKS